MSLLRHVARRLVFAVVATMLVMTVAFFAVASTADPPMSMAEAGGIGDAAEGSARDADTALHVRLYNWLHQYVTLNWGVHEGTPVTEVVLDRLAVTATYLAPAFVVASLVGTTVGFHAAMHHDDPIDRLERLGAYVGFSVPAFVVGYFALYYLVMRQHWLHPYYAIQKSLLSPYNLKRLAVPALVLTVAMVAILLRHARSETLKYRQKEFVKLARAKGAGKLTIARHILRLAVGSLFAVFVGELLGVLFLSIIAIELIFKIPGFGQLLLTAAQERSSALVMAVTSVGVAIGIGGNFLGNLVQLLTDPRISDGER